MGLLRRLGSFGQKIWSVLTSRDVPIREAAQVADLAGVSVGPGALAREYRKMSRVEGLEAQIAEVMDSEYIPLSFYQTREIPWDKPFAYKVSMYGRDLATGRYTRTDRWLTFSRELEVGEILDVAEERFSAEGAYPQVDVMQMSVTGAELRAGEWPTLGI